MLVLSRKVSQKIQIGDDITVRVVKIAHNVVRIGVDAPRAVKVMRAELVDQSTRNADSPVVNGGQSPEGNTPSSGP